MDKRTEVANEAMANKLTVSEASPESNQRRKVKRKPLRVIRTQF
jgi:hypothetical protein